MESSQETKVVNLKPQIVTSVISNTSVAPKKLRVSDMSQEEQKTHRAEVRKIWLAKNPDKIAQYKKTHAEKKKVDKETLKKIKSESKDTKLATSIVKQDLKSNMLEVRQDSSPLLKVSKFISQPDSQSKSSKKMSVAIKKKKVEVIKSDTESETESESD